MTCDDEGHSYFASFPDDRVRWTRKPYYSLKFALADDTLAEVFGMPSLRLILLERPVAMRSGRLRDGYGGAVQNSRPATSPLTFRRFGFGRGNKNGRNPL